jgi:FAD:protein FMN transferase
MAEAITRRRCISILAAAGAIPAGVSRAQPIDVGDYEWCGFAMGTDARILFCAADRDRVAAAVEMVAAEIERLENALSLFRADSEICRLNAAGSLALPSADLRRALALGIETAQATNGLFDPTVQSLWQAHVDWFSRFPDRGLPADEVIAAARRRVDWRKIAIGADEIRLGPGQRITLNGLGQGYVTDRIADLLRGRGFDHVLVDLGEQRALGMRPQELPWSVARAGGPVIELRYGALATSEGAGCVLGAGGAAHHLFDPRTGRSAQRWRRMIVHNPSAALADALSTALYIATPTEIARTMNRIADTELWATAPADREYYWRSNRFT